LDKLFPLHPPHPTTGSETTLLTIKDIISNFQIGFCFVAMILNQSFYHMFPKEVRKPLNWQLEEGAGFLLFCSSRIIMTTGFGVVLV
jgi:hypothetical protein